MEGCSVVPHVIFCHVSCGSVSPDLPGNGLALRSKTILKLPI